jgi:hypothetical protein
VLAHRAKQVEDTNLANEHRVLISHKKSASFALNELLNDLCYGGVSLHAEYFRIHKLLHRHIGAAKIPFLVNSSVGSIAYRVGMPAPTIPRIKQIGFAEDAS